MTICLQVYQSPRHGVSVVDVPEEIRVALFANLDFFGLEFGCFDFALEEGSAGGRSSEIWTFIECNPNGQWGWLSTFDAIAHAFADVLLNLFHPQEAWATRWF
ncbi:hypothetical protein ACQEVF_11620 [Nonomuraea polychroma]|uniref:hypothetical protein n=1 Tax=Nonomuraea polychroma TaxID=46176 RepID=UPI003D8A2A42